MHTSCVNYLHHHHPCKTKTTTFKPRFNYISLLGLIVYRIQITWNSTCYLFATYSQVVLTPKSNRFPIVCFRSFVLVSSDKLDLTVRVEDEFTYFADGQPLLAGAKITLRSRLRSVSLTQYTNESGRPYNSTAMKLTNGEIE